MTAGTFVRWFLLGFVLAAVAALVRMSLLGL